MKNPLFLVGLITVCMICFCFGCAKNPTSDQIPPKHGDLNKLTEEIKAIVLAANKAAFDMCVQGFNEEIKGEAKTPFASYGSSLRKWYSEEMTSNLEMFYNHHLGEWGYEMGFAFPLHTRELVEEGFISLELSSATKASIRFKVPAGHEETCITEYTLEKEDDRGSWIITSVE